MVLYNIYLDNKKAILASRTLKDFEDILPAENFYRIHNASIVNVNFIQRYIKGDGGQVVLKNGTKLDVARRRKEYLLKMISGVAARL